MKLTPAILSSTVKDAREQAAFNLSGRDISHIDDISFCIAMRRLDLSKNRLQGEGLSGLQYCKGLTWLSLAHNRLEGGLEHLSKLTALNVLNLAYNELSDIPLFFADFTQLKALILNDNRIQCLEVTCLPKSLDSLVVSRNRLEVVKPLDRLAALEKVSLSHNQLHQLPELSKCWKLRELRLNNNRITKVPKGSLPPDLSLLDLGKNPIERLQDLAGVEGLRHLRSLNLAGCPVASHALDSLLATLPRLHILNNQPYSKRPK